MQRKTAFVLAALPVATLCGLSFMSVAAPPPVSSRALQLPPVPPPPPRIPTADRAAASAAADARARAVGRADKELPNFALVAPGIYRGAAPTEEGLRRLKEIGVRTVIDLRIEKRGQAMEAEAARELGLHRLRLPMGREAPTARQVAAFVGTLSDPARRPVFIHCQHGADRTGAMVGIWRVTQQNWDFGRTYREMRRYGFKPYLSELKQSVASRAR